MDRNNEYQGWTNRETWAVNLWLSNDQGLYNWVNDLKANTNSPLEFADALKSYVEDDLKEYANESERGSEIRTMFDDIGSLWRVEWKEIATSWSE